MKLIFKWQSIFLLVFVACDGTADRENDAEYYQYFEEIYFKDIPVFTIHEEDFAIKPFYPFKGKSIMPPHNQFFAKLVDKGGGEGENIFGVYRFYFTSRYEGFLVRTYSYFDSKSQTIYCLVYDHTNKQFIKKIDLAFEVGNEGASTERKSLIFDINKDGVLDLLTYTKHQYYVDEKYLTSEELIVQIIENEFSIKTLEFDYGKLMKELNIYTTFPFLTQKELNTLSKGIDEDNRKTNPPEKWTIVLAKVKSITEAVRKIQDYETSIQVKKIFKYQLNLAPIRIYQTNNEFFVAVEGFFNQNLAALSLVEVKKQLTTEAELINVNLLCNSWVYNCDTNCFYTCND